MWSAQSPVVGMGDVQFSIAHNRLGIKPAYASAQVRGRTEPARSQPIIVCIGVTRRQLSGRNSASKQKSLPEKRELGWKQTIFLLEEEVGSQP
ncbi:hypothetical protein [Bradyrhizobium cytisi]|uniref:Uncharacterized protein n=1 Tax=Bradyrhizobium cytisi TaxID=515489 RepID=A0A5S4VW39_9BRAD|nr:hypothetical protein [Bradyrhizobium cytisi]TYL70433.1 hypothetical protein FXB38_41670 [Bradyrhizobium cytisi]